MGHDLRREYARIHCSNSRRTEVVFLKVRWFVHLRHDDASLPKLDDGVELFVGSYKKTDNWALKARLDAVNSHRRTLVAAATAYPEMQQRDKYQEAIDFLQSDADALERAIEFRRESATTRHMVCHTRTTP